MSIFRREKPTPPTPQAPAYTLPAGGGGPIRTHIARGSSLQGTVTGPVELLVEGEVAGEIRVEAQVVVGAEGIVRGPVSGSVVLIAGRVSGDVRGSDRVEVAPTGHLEGDIFSPRIVVSEGAFFKGKVEMQANQTGTPRSSRSGADSKAAAETRKN